MYKLDKIKELGGDDEEFIISIVQVFAEETPADLESLTKAISEENFTAIYQSAHKMKPNLDLFGMEETRQKILQIEGMGKEGNNLNLIKELHAQVSNEVNALLLKLKADFNL